MGSCMDVRIGNCVDVCRAVRKAVRGAVCRAVRRDDCTAINRIGRLQNLPSILVLRVSRALELRIGL